MSTKSQGDKYEDVAVEYLQNNGYLILDRNYRYSNKGEIDIIASKEGVIYFFEVKYRKSIEFGHPSLAVDGTKLEKLEMSIMDYLETHFETEPEWILQVVSVYYDQGRLKIEVEMV